MPLKCGACLPMTLWMMILNWLMMMSCWMKMTWKSRIHLHSEVILIFSQQMVRDGTEREVTLFSQSTWQLFVPSLGCEWSEFEICLFSAFVLLLKEPSFFKQVLSNKQKRPNKNLRLFFSFFLIVPWFYAQFLNWLSLLVQWDWLHTTVISVLTCETACVNEPVCVCVGNAEKHVKWTVVAYLLMYVCV